MHPAQWVQPDIRSFTYLIQHNSTTKIWLFHLVKIYLCSTINHVGATLVVSGDGRYYSKDAIQVHSNPFYSK